MPKYKQDGKTNSPAKMVGGLSQFGRAISAGQGLADVPIASQIMGQQQPVQSGIANAGNSIGATPPPVDTTVAAPGTENPFSGQKFEISPVQMKGSFSPLSKKVAEGVYGNSQQRQMSVQRTPLNFKDQTGDGKITRADVIKARTEGYEE